MRDFRFLLIVAGCLFLWAAAKQIRAAEPTAEQLRFFEKQVRPVLVAHCVECHGPDAQESDLRVDSLGALVKGGTRGPALVPGNASESLLIRAIGHGETLQMPPKKKLAPKQIADLAEWVKNGAAWPNETLPVATTTVTGLATFTEKQTSHWAFQPVRSPPLPNVRDASCAASPIDYFLLAKLEPAGLSFAPQAERRVLLRRATFDLTGLPPTLDEQRDFLADDSPDAWDRLLDRLLASPHYGEKYGRHWLDLARYADSNGLDENLAYANAFRYRDYLIAAFNKDKPYDRFVAEQIAGDLLPHANQASEHEGLVATGFLSLGAKMLAEDDPVKMQMDIIDEQIDTLGKCFLGLTLGCARCHDHKFDPVDMRDYYGLAGILKSTKTMLNHNVVAQWQERPLADKETLARRDAIVQQASSKRGEANTLLKKATDELLTAERARAGEYLYAAALKLARDDALSKVTARGDLPAEQQAQIAGLILREAENYDRGNVIKDTTSYGQGIGVLVNRGEQPNFAEYDVEVPQPGKYQFELRYAAANSRPCKVFVNGKQVLTTAAGKVTGSWHPEGQKWFVEGALDLPSGKLTLRLEQPTFFPHIDKLLLAPAAASEPVVADEPSPASDLREEFIEQWRQALMQAKSEPTTLLSLWHGTISEASTANAEPPLQDLTKRLDLQSVRTVRERADRFAKLFAEALAAWQAQRATPEGQKIPKLADPALEAARELLFSERGPFREPKKIESLLQSDVQRQLKELRTAATDLEKSAPYVPEAMAVSEDKPQDVRIHFRGNHLTLGPVAPRQFLRVVAGPEQSAIGTEKSGRLELAQWLTRPDHPLTGRVMANRLWQWHFGQGLVRSSDNYGLLGEAPTHPELLDWLSQQLIDDGWSLKKMHRRLMTSAAYQQQSNPKSQIVNSKPTDPENRLWSYFPRRRLTAEEMRDSIFAVSDRLNTKMGGTYLPTKNRNYVTSTANVNPAIYDLACRSVYVPVVRSALYEVFQAFDFPDPSVLIAQREATTVAPQALFMLNSQITANSSRNLAERLLSQAESDDAGRIRLLYERAYGRPAETTEVSRSLEFLERYRAATGDNVKAWQALCRAILAANEFVYVD